MSSVSIIDSGRTLKDSVVARLLPPDCAAIDAARRDGESDDTFEGRPAHAQYQWTREARVAELLSVFQARGPDLGPASANAHPTSHSRMKDDGVAPKADLNERVMCA